jgi:hypothetical protein
MAIELIQSRQWRDGDTMVMRLMFAGVDGDGPECTNRISSHGADIVTATRYFWFSLFGRWYRTFSHVETRATLTDSVLLDAVDPHAPHTSS